MVGHLPFACKPSIIQIRNLSYITLLKVSSCRPSLILGPTPSGYHPQNFGPTTFGYHS
jgi:hypothetical protein